MPNESSACLASCCFASHLIVKGGVVLVTFAFTGTRPAAVAEVLGDSMSETI